MDVICSYVFILGQRWRVTRAIISSTESVFLHLSALDMSTKYSSWGVKRRHLFPDPIAETPLYIGTDETLYKSARPPAAPAAEFRHPFRCFTCRHWLRDSSCQWTSLAFAKVCAYSLDCCLPLFMCCTWMSFVHTFLY